MEIDNNVLAVPCPLPFLLLLPLPPPSSLTLTLLPLLLFFLLVLTHILKTLGGILASFWHPLDTLGATFGAIGHHSGNHVDPRVKIGGSSSAKSDLGSNLGFLLKQLLYQN